ncbi:hypothetical protein Pmani_011121 [Petrolisthes manimaculis]|uniref:C2H2-type domain-containing protein n=1 Tax=Petrolisthes manimaculis TaxID=1843537 RepID=A0AAE1Q084_9EUCA|nr:hypothetical protein Pmani_011121 [Petrolisthes manimaculis]
MENFNESSEVSDGSTAVMAGDEEDTMESPTVLAGQVVMASASKDESGEGQQVIMTDSEAVVIDGSQVVMDEGSAIIDGSHVIMDSQMVMDGTQVVIKETQDAMDGSSTGVLMEDSETIMEETTSTGDFQPPVLQDSCQTNKTEDQVDIKEDGLENEQYAESNQILGLVQHETTEEVPGPKGNMMEVEDDLDPSQGEMLLRNLVNETFQSSASTTPTPQPSDNIIVTTSTINTSQDNQQSLTSPTLVSGAVNNNMAVGGVSGVVSTPTRIIVQTNQGSPVKANPGHFLIQVGGTPVSVAQPQLVSTSNKNHIVIKAGSNQGSSHVVSTSAEAAESGVQSSSIFRVIIPEGTTKYTKTPSSATVGHNEPVRKHVQINLSDGTLKKTVPVRYKSHTSQTSDRYGGEDDGKEAGENKKFYECPTCNSKFMKPLYLRKHMRSCKKEEAKVEKTPLYMCSFCKMTFKTRPQISQHFLKCYHSPYRKKPLPVKRKGEVVEVVDTPAKKGRMEVPELDPALEQAVQFRCQDCDRTFSKERQYSSHIKRCTKVSVHDLSGPRIEEKGEEEEEEDEPESREDPFADPDPAPPPPKRGRGPGRRGRPPGRGGNTTPRGPTKSSSQLFDGAYPVGRSRGLLVADNEGLVRSTTGLAHTVQLSLETANQEGQPQPTALVADSKGVRGRGRPPQAWSLVCALCQKMFITKAALAHHVISEHGADLQHSRKILQGKVAETESVYRCPVCSLNYETEETFLEHMVLQHTARLQETFTQLQGQTATFVCSLCSLVLLTRNLLIEHLSLTHLEELESQAQGDNTHVEIASKVVAQQTAEKNRTGQGSVKKDGNVSGRQDTNLSSKKAFKVNLKEEEQECSKPEPGDDSSLECGFCGEEMLSQEDMVEHYIECHGVETDEDGCLLDLGIDVDIRVKDTKGLLQLADGRMDDTVPEKTVLIRKKPRQSWQCKECQQVFSKHTDFLKHMREVCTEVSPSSKPTVPRGGNFKCLEPGCSHLSFYQVKLLFRHMEEVHRIVVPKEFKTFKTLDLFYHWLTGEEKKYNVRYIRDTTRIEKNDMKLIQMVCHRFHTAKIDQSKEKREGEGSDGDSPSKQKRRWFVRIQRSSNCHARIHLKVQYNPVTREYDGETQMVYYPQHTHAELDHPQDLMNRVMERHARDKSSFLSRNGNRKRLKSSGELQSPRGSPIKGRADREMSGGSKTEEDNGQEQKQTMVQTGIVNTEGETLTMDQYMKEFCQTQLKGEVEGTALVVSSSSGVSDGAHTVIQAGGRPNAPTVLLGGDGEGHPTVLVEGGEPGTYVVQEGMVEDSKEEASEEYVLPADEAEWNKLFDVLRIRLVTSELSDQEKGDGEGLLSYQNVISYLPLAEQVTIFQQLCVLTNTAIETAD